MLEGTEDLIWRAADELGSEIADKSNESSDFLTSPETQ